MVGSWSSFASGLLTEIDFVALTLCVLAGAGALHFFLSRAGHGDQFGRGHWLLIITGLSAGWFAVNHVETWQRECLQRSATDLSHSYASQLENLGHASIGFKTSPDDPRYLRIIETQNTWLRMNPSIANLYTLRRLPGNRIVRIVDSEHDYNRNGVLEGHKESRVAIGGAIPMSIAEETALEKAWTGNVSFTNEVVSDQSGDWIVAYVPIYGRAGRQEAVLAVEFPAAAWIAAVSAARHLAIGIVAALFLAVSGVTTVFSVQRYRLRCERENARAIAESEERTRSLFEASPESVYLFDLDAVILDVNSKACGCHCLQKNELVGKHLTDITPPEHHDDILEHFATLVSGRACRIENAAMTSPSGKRLSLEISCSRVEHRNALAFLFHVRNVTKQHKRHRQVRRLAAFSESNPNPIVEFDEDNAVSYLNTSVKELLEESGVENAIELFPVHMNRLLNWCRYEGKTLDGIEAQCGQRTISWNCTPGGVEGGVVCYGVDLTHRLQLESQLQEASKTKGLGKLAGGIAHEFNNALAVIEGHAYVLMDDHVEDNATVESLREVIEASERAAELTHRLLHFSRTQPIHLETLDLNHAVDAAAVMVRKFLHKDVSLKLKLRAEPSTVRADETMVEQLVLNLALNGLEAMPEGGRLTITTANFRLGKNTDGPASGMAPGDYIGVRIADTGCGFEENAQKRLFEPCYTTKHDGKGVGLGLPAVEAIAVRHGGWIEVKSEPGRGAAFTAYFPETRAEKPALQPARPDRHAEVRGGAETILLVEDEPALRHLATKQLERYGYRLLAVATGRKALQLWSDVEDEVDLLLTDIIMPGGVSGSDLGHRLREKRPDLPVVYVSGFSGSACGDWLSEEDIYLRKPYDPALLARAVRNALDARAPSRS